MRSNLNKSLFISSLAVATLAGSALPATAQTLINGAGATFPSPIYTKWFVEYHKLHSDVQFNYQPLGSGAGIKQVTEGTVDFGASDILLSDDQLKDYRNKHHFGLLMFPTVAGAAVPTYNIPGVKSGLNFTAKGLAGIFLGSINKWNDPELTKPNPGVKLPNADIVVVHRSDGSGTTYCWTDFLGKVSGDWKLKVGNPGGSVNWPVGLGAKGSDGVSGQVQQTPNSIGYVELIFAEKNNIPYGNVQNSAGAFIKPDLGSITAAAAGVAKTIPDDFRISIANSPGKTAYPVSTFTWLLIPEQIPDGAKQRDIKDFLHWMLTNGQDMAEGLTYARLPKEVVAKEEKAISKVH
ncbi:MAG: phosphate ABC transporter substrate-binding protein PstS [Bryobacteraceae bacterium]|jgi:phosphate transport system substrate-binding protein